MRMPGAIFAGTFDPPTLGHLDIIGRAVLLFGQVHVVLADNPSKRAVFSPEERIALLERCCARWPEVRVHRWDGLVADFARDVGCRVLVRGLRDAADLAYEQVMASMNRRLDQGLESVFLPCEARFADVSSSAARVLARHRNMPPGIVPDEVLAALEAKFGSLR